MGDNNVNIELELNAFSDEEKRLLLSLYKANNLKSYCTLALKYQFNRYLHSDKQKSNHYDLILSKLDKIEDYLANRTVTLDRAKDIKEDEIVPNISPILEVQSTTKTQVSKQNSNTKFNKLKKLRGG